MTTKPTLTPAQLEHLTKLIEALRKPMPQGFRFAMETVLDRDEAHPECGTAGCALGLASVLWPEFDPFNINDRCEFFGLTRDAVWAIFFGTTTLWDLYGQRATAKDIFGDITPGQVADQLEAYLEGRLGQ